ncbi:MAG: hypothetical protein AAGH15_06125 [Myxococcota bacterium]
MDRPRMRPRFAFTAERTPDEMMSVLRSGIAETSDVAGHVFERHADLAFVPERRTLWSPYLVVELRNAEGDPHGTLRADEAPRVVGRFSPQPSVWTFFTAVYAIIVFAGIGAAIWGLSAWTLGRPPWGLLGVPAAMLVYGFVYGATLIGQGLSADQMHVLRRLVEEAGGAEATLDAGVEGDLMPTDDHAGVAELRAEIRSPAALPPRRP